VAGGRNGLRNLGVAALSSLLALVLAELLARAWLLNLAGDEAFRTYASVSQLEQRLGAEAQSISPYAPHRYVGFVPSPGFRQEPNRHDARGYRGAPVSVPKPDGELRIVCLGGSTTYSDGVKDPADSYPAQLEQELHGRGLRKLRVVNGGASGYSSWETLINFQLRVLDLAPDVVIVYHALNDIAGRLVWPPSAYRGDNSGAVSLASNLGADTPLLERSTLARIALVRFGWAPSHLGLFRNFARPAPSNRFWDFMRQLQRGTYPSGLFRRVSAEEILSRNPPIYFRRNLENLVHVAHGNGIRPVLLTFAHCDCGKGNVALQAPEIRRAIAEHNEVILAVGKALDVPVYDLAAAFPGERRYFVDSVHFTAEGNRERAVLIADFLVREGIVPRPPAAGAKPRGPTPSGVAEGRHGR